MMNIISLVRIQQRLFRFPFTNTPALPTRHYVASLWSHIAANLVLSNYNHGFGISTYKASDNNNCVTHVTSCHNLLQMKFQDSSNTDLKSKFKSLLPVCLWWVMITASIFLNTYCWVNNCRCVFVKDILQLKVEFSSSLYKTPAII